MTPRNSALQPCVEGAGCGCVLTLPLSSGDSSALRGVSFALSLKTDVQGEQLSVAHMTAKPVQVGFGNVCLRTIAGLRHAGPTGPCFSRDEFNIKVLQAFVELHEFADLNLVQALR